MRTEQAEDGSQAARQQQLGPWWLGCAIGAFAGLLLVAAGIQFSFFNRVWLDVPATVVWVTLMSVALARLVESRGIAEGLGMIAAAAFLALAVLHRQPLAAWLAGASMAFGLLCLWLARQPSAAVFGRLALGAALAAAGVALSFPGRPALSTGLIPAVVLGLPLTALGLAAALRATSLLRPGAVSAARFSLVEAVERQGWPPRRAAYLVLAFGVVLALAAVAMSGLQPFESNLSALLAVAACLAVARAPSLMRMGRLPLFVYSYGWATLLVFVLSLRFGFLNFIFVGTLSGHQGWDFFQMPRAFNCFVNGISLYETDDPECIYGPWATPFLLHPLAAIVPGGLLYQLPPWISYSLFAASSIAVLLALSWLFARLTSNPLHRSLIFLALTASWPLYLQLWMGQSQIFVVLSFGLIAGALFLQRAGWSWRSDLLVAAGLLAGLLIKPFMASLALPLLIASETRRAAGLALIVYGLVSLAMVAIPQLNPTQAPLSPVLDGTMTVRTYLQDNGNLRHWGYLVLTQTTASTGLIKDREVFSASAVVSALVPRAFVRWWLQLGVGLAVLYQAWAVAAARTNSARRQQLRLAVVLAMVMYPIFYARIFEYHYATLAIVPVVFLLMLPRTTDGLTRRYLWLGLAAYLPFLLPSIFVLVVPGATTHYDYNPSPALLQQMTVYRVFRVLPALIICLSTVLAMRHTRLLDRVASAADRSAQPA